MADPSPAGRITDHAVLRYMERCHGIDVGHYRRCCEAEIEDRLVPGNAVIPLDDMNWVIRDGRLITIIPQEPTAEHKEKRHGRPNRQGRQFDPRLTDYPDSHRGKWNRHPERGLCGSHRRAGRDACDGEDG